MTIEFEKRNPKRLMTKEDSLRHAVHAAIRQVWREEDPIANCILVEAANDVSVDLLKHAKKSDPVWDSPYIIADKKKELRRELKKSYNFLKHADRDATSTLPVYEMAESNELFLFLVVIRYGLICGRYTEHMKLYLGYCLIWYPTLINAGEISMFGDYHREKFVDYTRTRFLKLWIEAIEENKIYCAEQVDDRRDAFDHGQDKILSNPIASET